MTAPASNSSFSPESKRPRIFLSHAPEDEKQARELYQKLQSVGTPWMAVSDLRAGDPWTRAVPDAISSADVAIVCLSRNSHSGVGFREIETRTILQVAAIKDYHFVIPVRFDDSPAPEVLKDYQWINLFDDSGYEMLFDTLEKIHRQIAETELRLAKEAPRSARGNDEAQSAGILDQSDGADVESAGTRIDEARSSFPPENLLLRDGSKGARVTAVQQRLKELNYNVVADGTYGPSTKAAVLEFQRANELRSTDGFVGANTWAALFGQPPFEVKRKAASRKVTQRTRPPKRDPQAKSTTPDTAPQSIREGLDEEARERKALNDKPVDDVNKDTLGFRDYVFALRDFIASQSTTTPLTISINGAWGSGKSSLMRMLQNQLEPTPRPRLWRMKLKWLMDYLYGTFFWEVGQLLVRMESRKADYIKLAFAFAPDEDVTDVNFDRLFAKYVDLSIRQDLGNQNGDPQAQQRIDKERKLRAVKTRFWARQAARRRKMTPPDHPTIWFNAWKFNQQEQLWAALATAVLGQLKNKYGFLTRLYLLTKLTWRRTDKLRAINQISRKLIVPIIVAGVVALYQIKRETLLQYFPSLRGSTAWLPKDTWLWVAPVLAAMWQAFKAIEDPFKIPIDELMTSPDYKGKVGFIGTFEEDFGRIVDVAIRRSIFWQPRKLVIFIDDLDRCGPTQAAGIVEAINLFLDSVGCVFVLGMDMNAVAISIEVKYKELTERMREDAPDDVSPGVLFLDKIVQIPFNVPRPNKAYMEALVKQITEPASRDFPVVATAPVDVKVSPNGGPSTPQPLATPTKPTVTVAAPATPFAVKVDRAGFGQEDIRQAIVFATSLLKENPRQVKRFINLFRLQVYIAHERGLLSDDADRLNPRTLAVWVAWYMQWPEILKLLASSAQTAELRQNLATIAAGISPLSEPPVGWRAPSETRFFKTLKTIRARESSSITHWSNLPWQMWTRDSDFMRCLKELEPYWQRTELLESMLDMTQVTVSEKVQAAATLPPVVAANSAAPVPA